MGDFLEGLKFLGSLLLIAFFMVMCFLDIAGIADLGWGPR